MQRKIIYIYGILLAGLFLYLGNTGGWFSDNQPEQRADTVSQATESRYRELEIRDYEGTRLDPSVGPRDNSISGIQQVDLEEYKLRITGLVREPLSYSYEQVLEKDKFQRLITLYCVEGWDATILWEGVRIIDLLDDAGILDSGEIVIFHCVDGYTTSMPLETIKARDMLLAYSSNGITLPDSLEFPFIVIAEDKLGYKWARWVKEIELSSDLEYEGYWESRGFSNEAEVDR
ncbi:MAG: molybdopterin-dependent oxidoreductase [Clostridia bacterium]|nr:molybdopterin-dependent oxidoreductase [Clostridia bacterium]